MAVQFSQTRGKKSKTDGIDKTYRYLLMLQKLQSYLLFGNHFCGVEISQKNGQEVLYITLLKKDKSELDIKNSFEVSTIESLKEKLSNKLPVFLVINNQNVLTKRIETDSKEPLQLVNKAFPNINTNEFVFEVLVQDSVHFISICRKEYVESLIKRFKKIGISTVNFCLGNSIVSSTLNFIDSQVVYTSNAEIEIIDNQIHAIHSKDIGETTMYDLNGISVSNQNLLSVVGALDLVVENYIPKTNIIEEKRKLSVNFRQKRVLDSLLKVGLTGVFVLLLVNYFYFSYYYNKVQILEQSSLINQGSKSRLMELNEKVGRSQKMVEDVFKSNTSRTSLYTSSLVQSLPGSILLNELNYQPLLNRIRPEKQIEKEDNVMVVKGESTKSVDFSIWLGQLENMDWIENFEVVDYSDVSNSVSTFTIKVNIAYD